MKSESRRLNKLKDESRNLAKRYKLPIAALNIIQKAGAVHGQQSRAIQVAVELIWNSPGYLVNIPPAISQSTLTGKTYKLPPRTVGLVEALGKEYGTLGNVLAACAVMLSRPDPREGLPKAPPLSKPDKVVYTPGETANTQVAKDKMELKRPRRSKKART